MPNAKLNGPKVVVIGGGTGLSTMLRGLKHQTENLCAIVSVTDDGGGSGVLRSELGMPPPGDIRHCLEALANTEPTMQALLGYRFPEGRLKGQSFGNLFLAALNGMCLSFDEAVRRMSEVLAITGRVLPVSNVSGVLIAEFENGEWVYGESHIAAQKKEAGCRIRRILTSPENPPALPDSLKAIAEADLIVIGPGSLYTSVIPNFLTEGIAEAVSGSRALRVYVLNIMTESGETEGYSAADHIRALFEHAKPGMVTYCLANCAKLPDEVLSRYAAEGSSPVVIDEDAVSQTGVRLICTDVADLSGGLARHDPQKLAAELIRIFRENAETRIYG
ncbi:MAG: YvcK family protein [Firmicutes bacterium]|nr:YvcK family protein [Bacillota bacterium]